MHFSLCCLPAVQCSHCRSQVLLRGDSRTSAQSGHHQHICDASCRPMTGPACCLPRQYLTKMKALSLACRLPRVQARGDAALGQVLCPPPLHRLRVQPRRGAVLRAAGRREAARHDRGDVRLADGRMGIQCEQDTLTVQSCAAASVSGETHHDKHIFSDMRSP